MAKKSNRVANSPTEPALKFKPFTVVGKGNSLWCKRELTHNVKFKVTRGDVRNFCESDEPYELQLFGPKTEWFHYTDKGIQADVQKVMLPLLRKLYPNSKINGISWSEQGMQPDGGWSFDVCCDYRENT